MSESRRSLTGADLRGVLLGGRYRLEALVGAGATAQVYAALDLRLRRRVAVKVVHASAPDDDQRARLLQEALVGASLSHPNLTPVLDLGEEALAPDDARLYVVMPLLEGETLRQVILGGALGWRRALALVQHLLAGLGALHRAGVIHRDLKPENCLVIRQGGREELRLVDLGLAKATTTATSVTLVARPPISAPGALVGTLAYLSPEAAQSRPVDRRADLYAAGVILFELLTRRPPFVGTTYEVLTAHVGAAPPSPRALAPTAGIPEAVEAVVVRALAKEPAARFASADEFADALDAAAAASGEPIASTRRCPLGHLGCDEAQAALAAWTRFEYARASAEANAAAALNLAWAPLKLLMSLLPEE